MIEAACVQVVIIHSFTGQDQQLMVIQLPDQHVVGRHPIEGLFPARVSLIIYSHENKLVPEPRAEHNNSWQSALPLTV